MTLSILTTKLILAFSTILIAIVVLSDISVESGVAGRRPVSASPSYSVAVTAYSTRSNAVVLHPGSGKIYASISSSSDASGNSVAMIDPATGMIEQSVWIGSEPDNLVLAPDGNTLYVGLDGSRSIRRFDISKSSPGEQFYAGFNTSDGPLQIIDFAVSPTNSNVVAVSRSSESSNAGVGVAIFDHGVQRPLTASDVGTLTFTDTEGVMFGLRYCCPGDLSRLSINATGVSSVTQFSSAATGNQIEFAAGRIYSASGHVYEVPSGAPAGLFPLVSAPPWLRAFAIDLPNRRAIYVSHPPNESLVVEAFDIDTFVRIGGVTIWGALHDPKAVARWGSNGLAISTADGPTYFIRSDLIGPGEIPQSAPLPTPTPSTDVNTAVRKINFMFNDMIYNPVDQKIYTSVPGVAGVPTGNTVTRVDPISGSLLSSVFIGSEPGKLGLSDDGTSLYASLEGSIAIRRYNTVTQTAGIQFPRLGASYQVRDLVVRPGNPQTVVVSAGDGGVAIYDEGVQRPVSPNIDVGPIEHNGTPNVVYAYNDLSTGFNLYKLSVDANGLSVASDVRNLIYRFNVKMVFDSGKLYCTDGRVVDPETSRLVGQFNLRNGSGSSYSVAVDATTRRAFFLSRNSDFVEVFNIDTFNKIGTMILPTDPQANSFATTLFKWGRNGLGFRVPTTTGSSYIALVQSPLVAESVAFDFDGDGKTDIGIFRPAAAEWWIQKSGDSNVFATQFGASTDRISPADFTGDGKTDVAFWRPSSTSWFVLRSEDHSFFAFPFGADGDIPVPADYDADGKADSAVFRTSTGTWFIRRSSDGGTTIEGFGADDDLPVTADYDGDGKSDIAIYRPSLGQWWINRSTMGVIAFTFGTPTDKPVPGDYTGDGKADVAFWRPSTGEWYILRSEDFSYYSQRFGTNGDIPSPGDYDGDGKFDPTVFRPSSATWFSARSTAGTLIQQFGANGDQPIPNAFVP